MARMRVDRNNATIMGIGDVEFGRILVDAGMPQQEVPMLISKLNGHWAAGGTIEMLLERDLESWQLSAGTLMLLKSILGITMSNGARGELSLRASLGGLALQLDAPVDDEYDDDDFEADESSGSDVNLGSRGSSSSTVVPMEMSVFDLPPPLEDDRPPPPPGRAQSPPQRGGVAAPTPPPPKGDRRQVSDLKRSQRRPKTDRLRTAKHILKGQWKLGKCIGKGSFGSVYLAMDEATGELMAVKTMAIPTSCGMVEEGLDHPRQTKKKKSAAQSSELGALCSEIELMRSFEHPNIVRYLGTSVDQANLELYIFQEWVPGGSLASLSSHYGPLAETVVRRYTTHITRGLEYLHDKQVIHRDIKCGNVLVDESGVAKLADFGASFRLGADGTLTQDMKLTMRGTPYFMAPEVLQQNKFGRRSDVWSLGGVVMQMATTDPPWKKLNLKTPMALFYHVVSSTGPPPLDGYPQISPQMRTFILRCFERDPQKRPHSKDLLDDPFLLLSNVSPNTDDDTLNYSGKSSSSNNTCNDTMKRIRTVTKTPSSTTTNESGRRRQPQQQQPQQRHPEAATRESNSASQQRGDLSSLKMRMSLRGI